MKKNSESPSVPKNDAITVAISTSGATIASSRIPRMIVITSSATGTITRRSRSAASLKSSCIALPAPTSAVTPPGRSRRLLAQRVDARERRLGVRVVVEGHVDLARSRRPPSAAARRDRRDAVDRTRRARAPPPRRRRSPRRPRAGRGSRSGPSAPCRERRAEHLETVDALDVLLEEAADRVVLLVGEEAEREERRTARRSRPARGRGASARGRRTRRQSPGAAPDRPPGW